MNTRITGTAAMLLAIAVASGPAMAQETDGSNASRDARHGHRGGPGPEMVEKMAAHLDLDAAQVESVQKIMDASRDDMDSLRQRLEANREAAQALDVDDPAYADNLEQLAVESGELATEMTRLRGRIRAEVHAVLTPEQRQTMAAQMGRRMGHPGRRQRARGDES